ncbi:MAG: helix-turn-helix domain-containing protein [Magnetovibrionaceae bacterium]
MSIGARLKALRLKKGESLQKVADAVGTSKAHIWELEKGTSKNPSISLLTRLADHFGENIAFIVGEKIDDETERVGAMFRMASNELDEYEIDILEDMVKNLVEKKKKRDSQSE